MMFTTKQKLDFGWKYLLDNKISFGSREADDAAANLFAEGMNMNEDVFEKELKEFKDAFIQQYKFHCDELQKAWKENLELIIELRKYKTIENEKTEKLA